MPGGLVNNSIQKGSHAFDEYKRCGLTQKRNLDPRNIETGSKNAVSNIECNSRIKKSYPQRVIAFTAVVPGEHLQIALKAHRPTASSSRMQIIPSGAGSDLRFNFEIAVPHHKSAVSH